MVYAARQVRRIARGGLPKSGYRPKGKRRIQLKLLQALPGVGPARAARLLEAFGSVEAVITASADKLKNVPGIGTRNAERLRWAVSEKSRDCYSDINGFEV